MTEKFEDVTVLGHPMLFTCLRVDRDTVPQGMYMYEVRHDDDQQGEPVQIANWIMNGTKDAEWNEYLSKLEDYGLSDYLGIMQKYLDAYYA